MAARRRGFTMVEVLVACVLLAFGIVSSLMGYSAVSRGISRARLAERMGDLGERKLDELLATADANGLAANGDFSEEGAPEFRWESNSQPSSIPDLNAVSVTVTGPGDAVQRVDALIFRPAPAAQAGGENTAPAAPGGPR